MPTILTRLPYAYPGAAGLTPLSVTNEEKALFANPHVLRWAAAAHGLDTGDLRCRKTDEKLLPTASMPVFTNTGAVATAYHGNPALVQGAGLQCVMQGDGWLPLASSFSIVYVGRGGPSDAAFLFGTIDDPAVAGGTPSGTFLQFSSGTFRAYIDGIAIGTNAYTRPYEDGPSLIILSWDNDAKSGCYRVNSGLINVIKANSMGSVAINNDMLSIGAAGNPLTGYVDGGDFAEVMTLDIALHSASGVALRGTIESYLTAKYNLPTP